MPINTLWLAILETTGFSIQTNFSTNPWKNELLSLIVCLHQVHFIQSNNFFFNQTKKAHNKKKIWIPPHYRAWYYFVLCYLNVKICEDFFVWCKTQRMSNLQGEFHMFRTSILSLRENATANGTYFFCYVQTVLPHQIQNSTGKGKILCKRSIYQQLLEN